MVRPRTLVLGPTVAKGARGKFVVAIFALLMSSAPLHAGDLRIPLPKRSKYTPVQKLNRDGVKAVEHHHYDKAKKLFYKAYLIDPNDPFTLNNLGYMAEIEGDSDRARRFYALSAELGSDAVIDKSNDDQLIGKKVSVVAGQAEDTGIKINRLNNEAIALLEKDRAPEADLVLQKALAIDPRNPFTLNNLGYAKEKEGEFQAAYQFYTAAADRNSGETVEVAIDKDWRGRPISDVARDNAHKLNKLMRDANDTDAQIAILNLRGVSALNRNDRRAGREFIEKAFKLDPDNAFTLNNMGFLAEMNGDKETADFYYERAREANRSNKRIAIATRKDIEGKKIGDVADVTDELVEQQMEAAREAKRREGGPVVLMRRNNTAVIEPLKPVHEPAPMRVSNANGELILPPRKPSAVSTMPVYKAPAGHSSSGPLQPLPDSEQPRTVKEGDHNGGLIMPLPDDQQPGTQPGAKEGPHQGGMIMPLPDDQQPGAKPQSSPGVQEGPHRGGMIMPLPDDQQPGAKPQSSPGVQEGPHQGGMIMPLPDNQQPGAQSQPESSPAVAAPPTATHTIITNPSSPATPPADHPAAAPPPSSQQQQTPQQNPSLLLPPPDNQQPAASQPNTVSAPEHPKHISDTDQKTPQQPPNGSAPKHISDQN